VKILIKKSNPNKDNGNSCNDHTTHNNRAVAVADRDCYDNDNGNDNDNDNDNGYDNGYDDDDLDEDDNYEEPTPKHIKVIIKNKKSTIHSYNTNTPKQIYQQIDHEPVQLPPILHLKSFLYQNQYYWIDQQSGYIFLPNHKVEPIGRLMTYEDIPNKRIEWYFRYIS